MRNVGLPKAMKRKAPKMKAPKTNGRVKWIGKHPKPPKEKLDLEYYGDYRVGLTTKEIKEYLKQRTGVARLGRLYIQFCKVAGINTTGVVFTQCCGKSVSLIYRYDVERFIDLMLEGTPTYFD